MPATLYRSADGEARIGALYDEALAALGADYESLTVGTRLGGTHVLAVGPEGAPPALFLPGGNFLNPTCLRWFLPLTGEHRLYARTSWGSRASARGRDPPLPGTATPSGCRTCSKVSASGACPWWASPTGRASP